MEIVAAALRCAEGSAAHVHGSGLVRTAVHLALAEKLHHSAQSGAAQLPTGTGEESRQGDRARDALWPAGTDAPASGNAAGTSV